MAAATRFHFVWASTVLSACALMLGGCFSEYHRAEGRTGRAGALGADAWPVVDIEPLRKVGRSTPREIRSVAQAPGSSDATLPPPDYTVEHNNLDPGGLLRVWSTAPEDDQLLAKLTDDLFGGFNPNAAYLTPRVLADPTMAEDIAAAHKRAAMPDSLLRSKGLVPATMEADVMLRKGISIQLPAEQTGARAGLVVYLTSIIPNKYEASVVNELRERGWAVLSIEADTRLRVPADPADLARIPGLQAQVEADSEALDAMIRDMEPGEALKAWSDPALQRRRTEIIKHQTQTMIEIHRIRKGRLECCDEESGRAAGIVLAGAVDELIGDHAMAASAAVRYLQQYRPDVPVRPLVLIGFSAGALSAPAVSARLAADGFPANAAVLVGGGADLSTILRETELVGSSIPIQCGDKPVSGRVWKALNEAYQGHTRLDPLKTAPLMAEMPVLQVHAAWDSVVPAKTGRRLYELFGRPDRIDYSLGHVSMFYKLPGVRARIADWVESHVVRDGRPADKLEP